jgi:hypothetical protein
LESFETVLAFREAQIQHVPTSGGIQKMKYLLRVLFVLALVCGGSSLAHADSVDFRATILDPVSGCFPADNSDCVITTPGQVLDGVGISVGSCAPFGLTGPEGLFGCLIINNLTGKTVTSLNLAFAVAPIGQEASCDAGGQDGLPSVLNPTGSCGAQVDGFYNLTFSGGAGIPNGNDIVVYEVGAAPDLFTEGSVSVGVTPEPDSLLLFSTGVMMAGLYISRRFWTPVRKSTNRIG